jgi:glycine cleavage system H protein
MTVSISGSNRAKDIFNHVAIAFGAIVALPLIAVLAFGLRFLIPVLIIGLIVGFVASPGFRRWFAEEADTESKYQGVLLPLTGLWVSSTHSWARIENDGRADVGVDDLVPRVLGTVKSIELPAVGTHVEQGAPLFSVVSEGRRLDIKAPVSGVVSGVNDAVAANPSLVNQGPYGWVVRLAEASKTTERSLLKHGAAMRRWFREDVDRMMLILTGRVAGVATMNDGGVLISDLSAQIDAATWDKLKSTLFEG